MIRAAPAVPVNGSRLSDETRARSMEAMAGDRLGILVVSGALTEQDVRVRRTRLTTLDQELARSVW